MHSLCTTVCPYAFYTVALDHMEAGKASILCSCEPVAAMVFGFFFFRTIPHNSKYRYGERGAADAKPKAQIILNAAKVSAASGGNSEPKQGQRSQSARGFCPRSTMRVPQLDIIEHFGNADAVPQLPERCLSRKAGIVRCCLCSLYAAAAAFLHSAFFTKNGTDFIMDKYAVGYSARSERLKRKGAIL